MTAIVAALLLVGGISRSVDAMSSSISPEQKVDSQLLSALRQHSTSAPQPGAPANAVKIDADGRTTVDIKATVSDALLQKINDVGGNVISSFPQYHAIRASIPVDRLMEIAAQPDVGFIRPAEAPAHN
jgi:hypothetical protein